MLNKGGGGMTPLTTKQLQKLNHNKPIAQPNYPSSEIGGTHDIDNTKMLEAAN